MNSRVIVCLIDYWFYVNKYSAFEEAHAAVIIEWERLCKKCGCPVGANGVEHEPSHPLIAEWSIIFG